MRLTNYEYHKNNKMKMISCNGILLVSFVKNIIVVAQYFSRQRTMTTIDDIYNIALDNWESDVDNSIKKSKSCVLIR